MSDYKVETGVPLPAESPNRRRAKYPFPTMEVGDSFELPKDAAGRVRSSAGSYGRLHNAAFTVHVTSATHARCWRVR